MFHFDRDIVIGDIQLWLDARRVKPFGFISHAHADHIARHKEILCSPPTAEFLKKRLKKSNVKKIPYGQIFTMKDVKLSLHPAGHILGSAQILVRKNEQSLLYTGDFRTGASRTVEDFETVEADQVILETTFGRPKYVMPPREDIEARLIDRCKEKLAKGTTPVVFAYALGKGQEALKILTDAGLPVAVEYNIYRYIDIYRRFGVQFKTYRKFKRSEYRDHVLLLPPGFRHQRFIRNLPEKYTIFLSGWGMDNSSKFRFQVDEVMPISDHADYEELISYIERIKPEEIYCTHGFRDFVSRLKNAGYRAHDLQSMSQRELHLKT
ncbi:MAG: hypothetical protein GF313_01850 [Caldithrix sp.]|nr:hypothetical protein [Caldithrix sp.]